MSFAEFGHTRQLSIARVSAMQVGMSAPDRRCRMRQAPDITPDDMRRVALLVLEHGDARLLPIADAVELWLAQTPGEPITFDQPIARCASITADASAVTALIEFPDAGVSARADEYLALLKSRVLGAVSVGFLPISRTPIAGGGWRYTSWEMLELSVVSVPANPSAVVTERSFADYRLERDLRTMLAPPTAYRPPTISIRTASRVSRLARRWRAARMDGWSHGPVREETGRGYNPPPASVSAPALPSLQAAAALTVTRSNRWRATQLGSGAGIATMP